MEAWPAKLRGRSSRRRGVAEVGLADAGEARDDLGALDIRRGHFVGRLCALVVAVGLLGGERERTR